jgi:CheY-like chemotaxis protein
MGERILREEGYSVVTVSDGETAMLRLQDVKPQLVIADIALNGFSGLQICGHIRNNSEYAGARVVLTVGALQLVDDKAVETSRADGVLRKPFEASALLETVARLIGAPTATTHIADRTESSEKALRPTRSVVVLDPDQVRAAVTVALDEGMDQLIDRVTGRVIAALTARR